MLKFFFIQKHKKDVLKYIYWEHERFIRDNDIRFSLPDEDIGPTKSTNNTLPKKPKYKRDIFDPFAVSATINSHLNDKTPEKPLSSTIKITFVQKLEEHIRNKNLVETDVYKAALMDRRLFSKMICDKNYKPSKDTAIALIIALKLSLKESKDMLERAGYSLSHSIKRDVIIEYFIKERVYNLNNINAFLHHMNEKIIGRNI